MGKASNLKKLRKLAIGLAPINVRRVLGERISGKELMGIEKDAKGKPIDPRLDYKRKKIVVVPLNHNRELKEAYKKAGMQGANAYVNAVNNYVNQNK